MDNDQAATILEQAADLLESEAIEWCQETYIKHEVCNKAGFGLICPEHQVKGIHYTDKVISACAVGALLVVMGETTDAYFDKGLDLVQMLKLISGSPFNNVEYEVEGWNDEPGRTREEVIDLFKDSAKHFRNGELSFE